MFSSRSLFAKLFNKRFPNKLDDINLFHRVSQIGCLFLVPTFALMESAQFVAEVTLLANGTSTTKHPMSMGRLIGLVMINGMCYTSYNQASFMVLSRTTLATHAVLNVFRRVFMICVTVYYFKVELNALNCAGIAIAVMGMLLFINAKSTAPKSEGIKDTPSAKDSPPRRRRAQSRDLSLV
jgi:solute carrier family 35 protein E1